MGQPAARQGRHDRPRRHDQRGLPDGVHRRMMRPRDWTCTPADGHPPRGSRRSARGRSDRQGQRALSSAKCPPRARRHGHLRRSPDSMSWLHDGLHARSECGGGGGGGGGGRPMRAAASASGGTSSGEGPSRTGSTSASSMAAASPSRASPTRCRIPPARPSKASCPETDASAARHAASRDLHGAALRGDHARWSSSAAMPTKN